MPRIMYRLEIQAFPGLWTPTRLFPTREEAEAAGNEFTIPCWRIREEEVK